MKVTGLPQTGNSAKFEVQTAKGVSFVLAFSFTLRTKIWQLPDVNAELAAATQIAEAIVGRHDPKTAIQEQIHLCRAQYPADAGSDSKVFASFSDRSWGNRSEENWEKLA